MVRHVWLTMVGEKLANLANHELFAKIFLANIHRCTENVYGIIICFDFSLFTKLFLTNSFYLHGLPKFPRPNVSHIWYYCFCDNKFLSIVIGIKCGETFWDVAFGREVIWNFNTCTTNYICTSHWIAYNEQHNEEYLMVFWWISCIHGTIVVIKIINNIIVLGEFLLLHSPTWHKSL